MQGSDCCIQLCFWQVPGYSFRSHNTDHLRRWRAAGHGAWSPSVWIRNTCTKLICLLPESSAPARGLFYLGEVSYGFSCYMQQAQSNSAGDLGGLFQELFLTPGWTGFLPLLSVFLLTIYFSSPALCFKAGNNSLNYSSILIWKWALFSWSYGKMQRGVKQFAPGFKKWVGD